MKSFKMVLRNFAYRYRVPEDYFHEFSTYYGPVKLFFRILDAAAQKEVERDMVDATRKFNVANDGTLVLPLEYVETLIVKA